MHPKEADAMANSVDPDQTASSDYWEFDIKLISVIWLVRGYLLDIICAIQIL